MTTDTDRLLSLAREVGANLEAPPPRVNENGSMTIYFEALSQLAAFAARIRQEEREHCIDLCANERIDAEATGVDADKDYNWAIDQCIAAIRSSGTSKGTAHV